MNAAVFRATRTLASELVRAVRGRRSQGSFSKRLGYSSNVVYTWECGRAWPSASRFFRVCQATGRSVRAALCSFYQREPEWLANADPLTKHGVAALLRDLKGNRRIGDVAAATRRGRCAVSRWLGGVSEPRLPDFLLMIDTLSLRLLDFLACFVEPATLPTVAEAWTRLEAARRTAYEAPWSHAVMRALELDAYRKLGRHVPGWLAQRVGLTVPQEEESLALLETAGQVRFSEDLWEVVDTLTVDTRRDPAQARKLKEFWAQAADDRQRHGANGVFSYNLFAVSNADLERVAALHRAYYRDLRAIVEQSHPAECVALVTVNLLELGEPCHSTGL